MGRYVILIAPAIIGFLIAAAVLVINELRRIASTRVVRYSKPGGRPFAHPWCRNPAGLTFLSPCSDATWLCGGGA
jgi:hypothetical protein